MDYKYFADQLEMLTQALIEKSSAYNESRLIAARCRKELYVLLAKKQNEQRYKNAALDRQLLLLLSDTIKDDKCDPHLQLIYEELIMAEEEYKGLEKMIIAFQTKISALQSLMKWGRD